MRSAYLTERAERKFPKLRGQCEGCGRQASGELCTHCRGEATVDSIVRNGKKQWVNSAIAEDERAIEAEQERRVEKKIETVEIRAKRPESSESIFGSLGGHVRQGEGKLYGWSTGWN